jgi:hypothetical protein
MMAKEPHPTKGFIIGDSDPLSFRRGSKDSLNIGEVMG